MGQSRTTRGRGETLSVAGPAEAWTSESDGVIAHVCEKADVERSVVLQMGYGKEVLIWTSGAVADDDGNAGVRERVDPGLRACGHGESTEKRKLRMDSYVINAGTLSYVLAKSMACTSARMIRGCRDGREF